MARLTFALCAAECMAIALVSGETTVSTVLLKPDAAYASSVRLEPGAAYLAFETRATNETIATDSASEARTLLDSVSCHNQRLKTAGLTLDTADVAHLGHAADV